jgi:hypothetical protein
MALQAGCRLGPNEFPGSLCSNGQVQLIRVRRVLRFSEEGAADYPS